jgi:hypothetical protein
MEWLGAKLFRADQRKNSYPTRKNKNLDLQIKARVSIFSENIFVAVA